MLIARTFRSLKHLNFRYFIFGQGISFVGTWMQSTAMSWLVYRITGSPLMLGLVGFCSQIPSLFFSPIAGALADKYDRRKLVILAQILYMLQAFVLAGLVLSHREEIYSIIVLSFILGMINAFDIPIRQSFVIEMVDSNQDDLSNAIALNSSMINGARLIGPSIAGFMIVSVGEGMCFLINALSYIAVIFALFFMKITPKKKSPKHLSFIKHLYEGVLYVKSDLKICLVMGLLVLVSLMGMSYQVLMPLLAKEIFHGDAHTMGYLMGAAGAGALTAAVYLASRRGTKGLIKIIPRATFLFGIALICLSFSSHFLYALPFLFFIGLGMMLQVASSNTYLQAVVPDDRRGRVMAFYTMSFMGMVPLGNLLGGAIAHFIGVQGTILIGGLSCVLGALYFIHREKAKLPFFYGSEQMPP